jgi:DNA-binding MarR family transcriptional regulator
VVFIAAAFLLTSREPCPPQYLDVKNLDGYDRRMRDEVDRLVEAWQRERSDLDLRPMEVLSRVTRLGHHLDRARRQAFTEHGIETWEFDVLAALRRAGTPYELSPGRLLKETLVTSGTMTNRVDRLATRGFVERLPDPYDRRGVLVRLTPSGRSTVDGALEGLLRREEALLAGLDATDQKQLAALLRSLVVPFENGA